MTTAPTTEKAPTFLNQAQAFFTAEPHGRKLTIPEFKALSTEDKIELSQMLNDAGYTHPPYTGPPVK